MRYLFVDCETGGLPENTSLLSLGMIVTDGYLDEIERVEWLLKPNDGLYIVTAGGLFVNKIDLVAHDLQARSYKEIKTGLSIFLQKHWSENNCRPLIPVGKNVAFDVCRLWDVVISRGHWEQYVSYQPLDINGAIRYLQLAGKLPDMKKTSLVDIAEYFGLDATEAHNALVDCRLYVEILRKLIQL